MLRVCRICTWWVWADERSLCVTSYPSWEVTSPEILHHTWGFVPVSCTARRPLCWSSVRFSSSRCSFSPFSPLFPLLSPAIFLPSTGPCTRVPFSCHSLGHISPLCRCSVSWSVAFWKNCSWIVHRGKLLFPCILVFHLTLFIVFIDQNFLRTVTCLWSTGQLDHQACYVLPALLMSSVLVDLTNCRCKIFRKNWV